MRRRRECLHVWRLMGGNREVAEVTETGSTGRSVSGDVGRTRIEKKNLQEPEKSGKRVGTWQASKPSARHEVTWSP